MFIYVGMFIMIVMKAVHVCMCTNVCLKASLYIYLSVLSITIYIYIYINQLYEYLNIYVECLRAEFTCQFWWYIFAIFLSLPFTECGEKEKCGEFTSSDRKWLSDQVPRPKYHSSIFFRVLVTLSKIHMFFQLEVQRFYGKSVFANAKAGYDGPCNPADRRGQPLATLTQDHPGRHFSCPRDAEGEARANFSPYMSRLRQCSFSLSKREERDREEER